MKINSLLLIYCYCLTSGLDGSTDRPRYTDPAMQQIFAAAVTVPLPTRERRGGKKSSTEGESESNATEEKETPPPDPPPNVTNELEAGGEPVNLVDRIQELEEDLSDASEEIKSLVADRVEMIKHINMLEDILDEGPGSIFKGWVYSPELKWVYVSPTIVPYSYSQEDGWMLYEYGTNPRRVYYYKTKEWKLLENEE